MALMAAKRFDATLIHTHSFYVELTCRTIHYARNRIDDAIKVVVKTRGMVETKRKRVA